MDLHAWLSRFYALPVTPAIAAAVDSTFADGEHDDLVHAHLSRNPLYFGGIDKTLSGFVVLDDEGDNYTLLDLRGGGQVWWQDHETRELEPRFASLGDYVAFRTRLADDAEDEADLLAEYAWTPDAADSSTATLLARYQWLAHALARPTRDPQGHALHTAEALALDAYKLYVMQFPQAADEARCFNAELATLGSDPHLAIYWLLHARLLGQDQRVAQVLAATAGTQVPLLKAFVALFGSLADNATLPVVPGFGERRAHLLYMAQLHTHAPLAERVRVLALDPVTVGIAAADEIMHAMATGRETLDPAVALLALQPIHDANAPAVWALRAWLQAQLGEDASASANHAAQLLARLPHDPLQVVRCLHPTHAHITDPAALLPLATQLLAWDDLMPRVLDLVERVQQLGAPPLLSASALASQRRLADELDPLWDADDFVDALELAPPALAQAMATRLARRPELADSDHARAWAVRYLLASPLPERGALVHRALPQLSLPLQKVLLPHICAHITDAGDALAQMLVALAGEEPRAGNISALIDADQRTDAILEGLQPLWGDPRLFEPLMAQLEAAPLKSVLVDRVGLAMERLRTVLDTRQCERLLAWAIARMQASDQDHWAPRVLQGLRLPALFPALRAALEEASSALAAGHTTSDKLVSALYSSLSDLGKNDTEVTHYLVTRLWAEQAYPRGVMWALHYGWSPALHAHVLQALAAQPSATAAAVYCESLQNNDTRVQPTLQVAELALAWPVPEDPHASAHLRYILLLGAALALALHQHEKVRAFHQRASGIHVPARSPISRSEDPYNPFKTEAQQAQLAAALDGSADAQAAALQKKLQQARAKGKPNLRISLDALGTLAGVSAAFIWFRDAVSGATLFHDHSGGVHYFDGYAITAPPFQAQSYTLAEAVPAFFHDATEVSQRWMAWKGEMFFDWTRLGAAINAVHGYNNAHGQVFLALRCPDAAQAETLLARVAANPAKGFVPCDPWYRDGHGEVARTLYHTNKPARDHLRLSDGVFMDADRNRHTGADAIPAMDALEAAARRTGGFTYSIEYRDDYLRPQDMPLLDVLDNVPNLPCPDTVHDIAHQLATVQACMTDHALLAGDTVLHTYAEAPATQRDMDALAAASTHPLPPALLATWQQHASLGWHLGGHGARLLTPSEVLAAGRGGTHWPLVVDAQGTPTWLLDDSGDEDSQLIPAPPSKGYAAQSLRPALVQTLLAQLPQAFPTLDMLWYGQRGTANVMWLSLGDATHATVLRLDRDAHIVAIRKGRHGTPGNVRFQRHASLAKAEAAFEKARATAVAAGQQPLHTA